MHSSGTTYTYSLATYIGLSLLLVISCDRTRNMHTSMEHCKRECPIDDASQTIWMTTPKCDFAGNIFSALVAHQRRSTPMPIPSPVHMKVTGYRLPSLSSGSDAKYAARMQGAENAFHDPMRIVCAMSMFVSGKFRGTNKYLLACATGVFICLV
jgi:hypothetical protein